MFNISPDLISDSKFIICGAQGDAEAFAITARASAEAEGMNMKAEAFREYKKAAKVEIFEICPRTFSTNLQQSTDDT